MYHSNVIDFMEETAFDLSKYPTIQRDVIWTINPY